MATKTQFLPYAHRYQDSTAGLRDALTNIQTGINQRGELRIREADQKIKQNEADRSTAQRSFLANYQPTLSEDHLTNEGLERYNSLIEHNKDRLSAMDDSERETVRQKLLRETADSSRVARTVREDIMGSGFFDPVDVDVLATSYGSGYTDYAAASKAAHDAEATRANDRAAMFKNAAAALGNFYGNGNTRANTGVGISEQDSILAGLPDKTTGRRPNFDGDYNSHKHSLAKRLDLYFHNDPDKDRKIGLLLNRGLVTYQKNALTQEIIDDFVKVATDNGTLGKGDNAFIERNVTEALKTYYNHLDKTGGDGGGRVAAPPAEVLRRVLFDGVGPDGLFTDRTNFNAEGFLTGPAVGRLSELFEAAHDEYLQGRGAELQGLLAKMGDDRFDFYNTPYANLNQEYYGELPPLSIQQRMMLSGRTGNEGLYGVAAAQAAQQPPAVTQDLGTQAPQLVAPAQPVTPTQQLEQLQQIMKVPPDVKAEHFGGLEPFPSAEAFTAVMLPMAEEAAARIGVSPQHILVQAILETGWGKKPIISVGGEPTHNLFGIKAYGNWDGPSALVNTTEVENGIPVPKQEPFRVYNSFAESFTDYVNFLQQNPRYSKALEVGATGGGAAFLDAIADAGYATDGGYKEKVRGVLRSVERRIPEGYTPGNFVASPTAQQYTNTQVAGIYPQQQGHPATEHLRALLNTYPQPYTEKSFTYDKIDAAFRRLGLTVPATEKVQANLTPIAAGVGSFPRAQVGAPAVPAAQPTPAASPAVSIADQESEEELLDRQLRRMDMDFLARREANLTGGDYDTIRARMAREQSEKELAQLQANARTSLDAAKAEIEKNYRKALREYNANQPVQGELSDIIWRAGPGEAPLKIGPFTFKVRHLPTDRNIDPPAYNGPGTARSAWEQTMSELLPSTQNTIIGPPQTAAPESRFSPPLLPEPVRSLPEQREESSNSFLMLRQDRQQELRDLIDSRTNQGINSNQQPEQEAAIETAGVSERYEMLADIIREFQQGVGSDRRMTLGNIA